VNAGGRFHKHQMLTVKSPSVWWVRLLRKPIFHTYDVPRMDRSLYPFCPCAKHGFGSADIATATCWTMSTLSVLHRWTGLTLFYKTWKGAPDERIAEERRAEQPRCDE
jgi:hypothetical protein